MKFGGKTTTTALVVMLSLLFFLLFASLVTALEKSDFMEFFDTVSEVVDGISDGSDAHQDSKDLNILNMQVTEAIEDVRDKQAALFKSLVIAALKAYSSGNLVDVGFGMSLLATGARAVANAFMHSVLKQNEAIQVRMTAQNKLKELQQNSFVEHRRACFNDLYRDVADYLINIYSVFTSIHDPAEKMDHSTWLQASEKCYNQVYAILDTLYKNLAQLGLNSATKAVDVAKQTKVKQAKKQCMNQDGTRPSNYICCMAKHAPVSIGKTLYFNLLGAIQGIDIILKGEKEQSFWKLVTIESPCKAIYSRFPTFETIHKAILAHLQNSGVKLTKEELGPKKAEQSA